MTNQEAFDIVYKKALKQMKRSHEAGDCLYRGPNGLQCFAGFLIEDHEYKPEFEHDYLFSETDNLHKLFKNKGLDVKFVARLRDIHDENEPGMWKYKLTEFAQEEGLTVPSV